MRYHNPVIPGFHPDPSITRKKEDFYLVTSSFEYFPGVPVFHSRNLVNWEQVGYCLTNERQLDLRGIRASKGIYAPTIRYHEGLFYMITTITDGQGGRKNIIVHAEDPAGVWSDPAVVDWKGIDPSLFWDDDGKCYFNGTGTLCKKRIMACFEIDPMTGERLREVRDIGLGSGGPAPEAPHIFNYNPPRNPAVSTAGGIGSVSRMVFFVLVLDILLDYILAHIAERAHKVTV